MLDRVAPPIVRRALVAVLAVLAMLAGDVRPAGAHDPLLFDEWPTLELMRGEIEPPRAPAPAMPSSAHWDMPPVDFRRPVVHEVFDWPPLDRAPDRLDRHRGIGVPLEGTSWRNRPFHVDWFLGNLSGEPVIPGRVTQGSNLFGGCRVGVDFDHYWGTELRMAMAHLPSEIDSVRNAYFDLHLLYYPWGDARWRPYFSLGAGVARFHFIDDRFQWQDHTQFDIPWGFGLKYYYRRWMALRLDILDNVALGEGGLQTMGNWSVTGGVEVRFGAPRRVYY